MFNQHPQTGFDFDEEYNFFMMYTPKNQSRHLKYKPGISEQNQRKKFFFSFAKVGNHFDLHLCRPFKDEGVQQIHFVRMTIKQGLGYSTEVLRSDSDSPVFRLKISSTEENKYIILTFWVVENKLVLASVEKMALVEAVHDVVVQNEMAYY